jgi:tetratricopeptide (TPR) repeat protein
MYLYTGEPVRAVAAYREVIQKDPSFLQARYNLAITYHRQGNDADALAELAAARTLATDDTVRKQIDDMITALHGQPPTSERPVVVAAGPRTPFQTAVEQAFRDHPIMGPRIVRFEWSGPGAGRVMVQNFPMDGMPPAVREKFAARLGQQLRSAQDAHHIEGAVRLDIADAGSGTVMATVTP